MDTILYLGSVLGISFVSGVNLYATVLTIGVGIRTGLITLNPGLDDLNVLAHPYVLIIAGVCYALEFVADKVPWIDSLWDTFHTVIRPLGAALLGVTAIADLDPVTKTIAVLLCGGVALSTHATKAGTRLAVNHSPEPFSNIALSITEDILVVIGTWFTIAHPYIMLGIVVTFLLLFIWLAPKIFRIVRVEFAITWALLKRFANWLWSPIRTRLMKDSTGNTIAVGAADNNNSLEMLIGALPARYLNYLESELNLHEKDLRISVRVIAAKGLPGLRNSIGYLCLDSSNRLFLLTRRLFRYRRVDLTTASDFQHRAGWFTDQLSWQNEQGKRQVVLLFKDRENRPGEIVDHLNKIGARATVAI